MESSGHGISFLLVWFGVLTDDPEAPEGFSGEFVDGLGVIEFFFSDTKNRAGAARTIFERVDGYPAADQDPIRSFHRDARSYPADLLGVPEADVSICRNSPFGAVDDRGVIA